MGKQPTRRLYTKLTQCAKDVSDMYEEWKTDTINYYGGDMTTPDVEGFASVEEMFEDAIKEVVNYSVKTFRLEARIGTPAKDEDFATYRAKTITAIEDRPPDEDAKWLKNHNSFDERRERR